MTDTKKRIENMTDEELKTLAHKLREEGRKHIAHAKELARYRTERAAEQKGGKQKV